MANAKLGRNELCWCDSGKKYKRCHLDRDKQAPLPIQEVLTAVKGVYGKAYCLSPDSSAIYSNGNIVRAHTIQRNGGLSVIARDGHVYNSMLHEPSAVFGVSATEDVEKEPNLVGVRKASIFTGFCGLHDNEIFAPLEKNDFVASGEQLALLGYRATCMELFLKNADMELTTTKRELDRGMPSQEQATFQDFISLHRTGVAKAKKELEELKNLFEEMLSNGTFEDLEHYVIWFQGTPSFLCTGIHQPTHDYQGNRIQELGHMHISGQWIQFSVIATKVGGAAIFSWLKNNSIAKGFICTLDKLSNEELPDAITRYAFEYFENTYYSPDWWDSLDKPTHMALMMRQMREITPVFRYPRPDDCLIDDGIHYVDWVVTGRTSSIECSE